jgi:ubiquitin-protein ligase
MMTFIRNKKQFVITKENRERILKDIDDLANLPNGVFAKVKQYEHGYYIKIIVDKTYIKESTPENKYNSIPDTIIFLMVVDYAFPKEPPKIFCQTNFCFPNLMDGRNLSTSIIPNWNSETSLTTLAKSLPNFIKQILTSTSYCFYGTFQLGSVYDLKNFNNMLVNTFNCKVDNEENNNDLIISNNDNLNKNNINENYTLILCDDCLVLFKNFENNNSMGKIIFWSTLFTITDMQINKEKKLIRINFYAEDKKLYKQLRLIMENVLFFREALVKRMSNLKIKIEANKLIKGQPCEKRLTSKDINLMNINQIEDYIKLLLKKIEHKQINFYIINTFSTLCGKAIEYYSAKEENLEKHNDYLSIMKNVLMRKDVQNIMKEKE